MKGYVPIHRKLFRREHWLAPSKRAPACRGWAWIDLIQLAQYGDYDHAGVSLGKGEFVASLSWMAGRWGWRKPAVQRFIERLKSDTMIETVGDTPIGTHYRLVNYGEYAEVANTERYTERTPERYGPDTDPIPEQEQTSKKQQTDTSDFEAVWALSRRGSKKKALDQYRRAITKTDHGTILTARKSHVDAASQPQYIKHLERWLRDECWADVETVSHTTPIGDGRPQPMRLRIPVRNQ